MFDDLYQAFSEGRNHYTDEDIRLALAAGVLAHSRNPALETEAKRWEGELRGRCPRFGSIVGEGAVTGRS